MLSLILFVVLVLVLISSLLVGHLLPPEAAPREDPLLRALPKQQLYVMQRNKHICV